MACQVFDVKKLKAGEYLKKKKPASKGKAEEK